MMTYFASAKFLPLAKNLAKEMKCLLLCQFIRKNFFNWTAFFTLIILKSHFVCAAQQRTNASHTFVQAEGIATVLFPHAETSQAIPLVQLGSGEVITLSFDELEPSFTRTLFYQFQHCNAQWQPTDIMDIEYVDGFNRFYDAEHAQNSIGTTTDYIHYQVDISTAPLRISGNYLVKVFDDDDPDSPLVVRPLMVMEQMAGAACQLSRLEVDNVGLQRLALLVKYGAVQLTDPTREVQVCVFKNNDLFDLRCLSQPTLLRQGEATYEDEELLTFEAGNEYRWIDNRDLRMPRNGTRTFSFFDPFYHQTLYTDYCPESYIFREEFNGGRHIEARHVSNPPEVAADYVLAHFSLSAPEGVDTYIYGALTGYSFSASNRLAFNTQTRIYERTLRVKQGFHNYQYLTSAHNTLVSAPTEGSFTDTENAYTIAIYLHPLSATYDQLIGAKVFNTLRSANEFVY